ATDVLLVPRDAPAPIADWWQSLQDDGTAPLDEIAEWLGSRPQTLADPLAALAEIDALRRSPECRPCRQRLQQQLWTALPQPSAVPAERPDGGAAGARYLQSLELRP